MKSKNIYGQGVRERESDREGVSVVVSVCCTAYAEARSCVQPDSWCMQLLFSFAREKKTPTGLGTYS